MHTHIQSLGGLFAYLHLLKSTRKPENPEEIMQTQDEHAMNLTDNNWSQGVNQWPGSGVKQQHYPLCHPEIRLFMDT